MAYSSNATRHSSSQQYAAFNSPTRRRLPFEPFTPARWNAATGRSEVHRPVSFDYPGQARQGGANDFVLSHTGLQRVVFRIIWPGYGHVEWCRAIPVTSPNGAPITRVALAVQIASNFARFVEKSQYETPSTRDWMVSPTCVRFEHLLLISLQNTFEDVWQADVALDLC
ncbi:hypothetical protein B0H14DRAFT_3087661 [Mycena olivaceomarginata]|nr:hypothetical protein B0H14DRAFT_3087661 [Mycena olivaceomarginata]